MNQKKFQKIYKKICATKIYNNKKFRTFVSQTLKPFYLANRSRSKANRRRSNHNRRRSEQTEGDWNPTEGDRPKEIDGPKEIETRPKQIGENQFCIIFKFSLTLQCVRGQTLMRTTSKTVMRTSRLVYSLVTYTDRLQTVYVRHWRPANRIFLRTMIKREYIRTFADHMRTGEKSCVRLNFCFVSSSYAADVWLRSPLLWQVVSNELFHRPLELHCRLI